MPAQRLFKAFGMGLIGLLMACTPTEEPVSKDRPTLKFTRDSRTAIAAYQRVSRRVEPVAERICRDFHPNRPRTFCDFQVRVINDPKQRPNAFQHIGRDGRPVISFNINMLRTFNNDDEIAFVFGHEAGHQIATHIEQSRKNAAAGAILGGLIIAAGGGDVSAGIELGAQIGSRSYSKKFELEADTIAAHVADRAGYNASVGAKTFDRIQGSSALLATHPPSSERKDRVRRTITQINRAKASGTRAPIVW